MARADPPSLRDIPHLRPEIVRAAADGDLVLFIGSGLSMSAKLPSWDELADIALQQIVDAEKMNYAELRQLKSLDAKRKLSIARLVEKEEGLRLDLVSCFKGKSDLGKIYEVINKLGCACVTTNYDELLAPRVQPAEDAQAAAINRVNARDQFLASHLDTPGTVVHLHGSVGEPGDMILTTADYLRHYDSDSVNEFLKHLFSKKTVLFAGYGLREIEVLEHIFRHGKSSHEKDIHCFLLQGFYSNEERLYRSLHSYYLETFSIRVIGYSMDIREYGQLDEIFRDWVPRISVRPPPLTADIDLLNEVLGDG